MYDLQENGAIAAPSFGDAVLATIYVISHINSLTLHSLNDLL
jgi:hypothetical protein